MSSFDKIRPDVAGEGVWPSTPNLTQITFLWFKKKKWRGIESAFLMFKNKGHL